jgi:hypothetical protein
MTTVSKEILKTTFKQDSTINPEVSRLVFDLLEGKLDPKAFKRFMDSEKCFNSDAPAKVENDRLLKGVEAAEIIGVHPYTVRKWARKGLLPSVRLPGSAQTLGYRLSDVRDFMDQNRRFEETGTG